MYINVQNLSLRREITWAWHHFYLEYKLKIALLFKPAGGFQSHICRFKIEMLFNLSAIKKEKKRKDQLPLSRWKVLRALILMRKYCL